MYCTSTVRVCTGTYALWILWLTRLPVYRCCTCTVLVLSTGTVSLASMCKYSYGVHVWYCGAPPLSVQELLRVDYCMYSKAYLYSTSTVILYAYEYCTLPVNYCAVQTYSKGVQTDRRYISTDLNRYILYNYTVSTVVYW